MRAQWWQLLGVVAIAAAVGCDRSSATGTTDGGGASTGGSDGGSSSSGGSDAGSDTSGPSTDCTGTEHIDQVVCAANEFLATLSSSELASVNLAYSDGTSRTKWSNLPGVERAGVTLGTLSNQASVTAALALMNVVLSDAGYSDLDGVRNADDYLAANGGNGGGGGAPGGGGGGPGGYGAGNYWVAIFGTPSASEDWAITFGGHHMAYNVTYVAGTGYPTPNHLGVEPKAEFTINDGTYAPLADEGTAFSSLFAALSAEELASAYLSGQTFSDVVVGPVEYGTGSSAAAKAKFPTGANRKGVLVSSLSAEQQALVIAAIRGWVSDYAPAISDALVAEYTSEAALADTYVAWGGTESAGPDPDVNGTYYRIDGPRLWIEVACQGGVIIQGKTHYHTIYRDKQFDYGGAL